MTISPLFFSWFKSTSILGLLLPTIAAAALTWETRQIQRTATFGDKEVVAEFPFKNTGTASVNIREIQTGCECTVADLRKRTYAPGETGTVKITFTLGERMGPQERPITLITDDPEAPMTTVTLRVDVPDLLTYSARMLHWTIGSHADAKTVEVSQRGKSRITSLQIKDIAPKQATARIESVDEGVRYRLHIQPTVLDAPTTVGLTFTATFADGIQRSFVIYALVR